MGLPDKVRQFSKIHRDPPCLIFGGQFCRRSPAGLILEIDIGQLLPGAVSHGKAGVQFLDGPRRREAAGVADYFVRRCRRRNSDLVVEKR